MLLTWEESRLQESDSRVVGGAAVVLRPRRGMRPSRSGPGAQRRRGVDPAETISVITTCPKYVYSELWTDVMRPSIELFEKYFWFVQERMGSILIVMFLVIFIRYDTGCTFSREVNWAVQMTSMVITRPGTMKWNTVPGPQNTLRATNVKCKILTIYAP